MSWPLLHSAAHLSVEWIFYALAESTLLALLGWLFLKIVARRNSGTRFATWFAVLVGMAALPLFESLWRMLSGVTAAGLASRADFAIVIPENAALYIFIAWAVLAFAGLLRVGAGLWRVVRLRTSATPLRFEDLDQGLHALQEAFRSPRRVALCSSSEVTVPTAIGFLRPAVLVPEWLLQEAPPTELRHVLLHELAHLRRRDDWTNLAQKIVNALLFFHPLVWWIENRLALEREIACDDMVLAQASDARSYAQSLARVAERTLERRQMALAQAAVHRMRHLSLRVTRILDSGPRGRFSWRLAIPAIVVLALACGLGAASSPDLVDFAKPAGQFREAQTSPSVTLKSVKPIAAPTKALFSLSQRAQIHSAKPRLARFHRPRQAEQPKVEQAMSSRSPATRSVLVTMTREQVTVDNRGVWHVRYVETRYVIPVRSLIKKDNPKKAT